MAMAETAAQPYDRSDRPGRRRPFSNLMRKLANFKSASSGDGNRLANPKRHHIKIAAKMGHSKNNNPYPLSGRMAADAGPRDSHYSFSTARSTVDSSATSVDPGNPAGSPTEDGPPTAGGDGTMTPTISADRETAHSLTATSHGALSLAGTSRTANGGLDSRRGGDSTFSSPAPSVRSLTTTLTTMQSMAPTGGANAQPPHHSASNGNGNNHYLYPTNSQVIHFNQPFPTATPASAIPAHLAPSGSVPNHPTTYSAATANNLLTDNASILTLASSSKHRRRRSLDTDASVRALAPSSVFGGSRESLPLSVLSSTVDGTPGLHRGVPVSAAAAANERASLYSATGVLAGAGDRNSFYAKQSIGGGGADGASVRSGLLGHGRAESVSGSVAGLVASSLANPREVLAEQEGDFEEEYR